MFHISKDNTTGRNIRSQCSNKNHSLIWFRNLKWGLTDWITDWVVNELFSEQNQGLDFPKWFLFFAENLGSGNDICNKIISLYLWALETVRNKMVIDWGGIRSHYLLDFSKHLEKWEHVNFLCILHILNPIVWYDSPTMKLKTRELH